MGFYGNITNTSKTQFQFDRVFPNKKAMMDGIDSDGVYAGRYVLVEYDTALDHEDYGIAWVYNGKLYKGAPHSIPGMFIYDNNGDRHPVYVAPNEEAAVTVKEIAATETKSIVYRVPPCNNIAPANESYRYIKVTKDFDFLGRDMSALLHADATEFEKFLEDMNLKETYFKVTLHKDNYEINTYYIYKNGKYELAQSPFDAKETYFDRGYPQTAYVVETTWGSQIFFSDEEAVKGYPTWKDAEGQECYGIFRVPKNCAYSTNTDYLEFWTGTVQSADDSEVNVMQLGSESSIYLLNFQIDLTAYPDAQRGYDSTVWQKVYRDGIEKYVMLAELNTVVPTFDICADAPSALPNTPHFDADSTNVYYKLHWQPQWGFRPKAADNRLVTPSISTTGKPQSGVHPFARNNNIDAVFYPSDEKMEWKADFYNTEENQKSVGFYNPNVSIDQQSNEPKPGVGKWDTKSSLETQLDAAIYYNKLGFDPKVVTYSSDLLEKGRKTYKEEYGKSGWKNVDNISLTPSGQSGQVYNTHNGYEVKPDVDVQEFSIMLPSLGNMAAAIWDMVFGSRDTNDAIAQTSKRNMDYQWEDARRSLVRHGLRMVGTEIYNGYSKSEVNTLAGCINSVHDLMGMIIAEMSSQELANSLSELDERKLYYVTKVESPSGDLAKELNNLAGQYVYREKTYTYIPVDIGDYTYSEVQPSDENFDYSLYYVKDAAGNYVQAKEGDTGPFYAKTLKNDNTSYTDVTGNLTVFDGSLYYYNNGCAVTYKNEEERLKLSDYIRESEYQKGRKYYTISNNSLLKADISKEFESGIYFYLDEGMNYVLATEKQPVEGRDYYTINTALLVDIKKKGYHNVYSPGIYFYKASDDNYYIDIDNDGVHEGRLTTHYAPIITKAEDNATIVVQKIEYVAVSDEEAKQSWNDGTWDPTSYYTKSGEAYVQNIGDYKEGTSYYYKRVSLVTQPTGDLYTVDKDSPLVLTPYMTNTFYRQITDSDGKVVSYEHLTADVIRAMIKSGSTAPIYAFGCLPDNVASGNIFKVTDEIRYDKTKFACQLQTEFYMPGKYHYVDGADANYTDLILDTYDQMLHDGNYYVLTGIPQEVTANFYTPGDYYTQTETGDYVLVYDQISKEDLEEGGKYHDNIFKKETLYVYEDTAGIFAKGAEWNPNVTTIPPSVTLAKREDALELRQLTGFARDLNTIHGLILKINKLLMLDDKLTRDQRTVQGSLNLINDKIAQFGKMSPREVLVVDDYGRAHSADIFTQQKDSLVTKDKAFRTGVEQDIYPEVTQMKDMEKQWITVNVDGDVSKPHFTVHHNFQPISNTTGHTNLNRDNVESELAGDRITLYTPWVDEMGHVVGKHEQSYTLPFAFKTIKTNGRSPAEAENATGQPTKDDVVAETTQDILNLNSGNKWIRIDTDKNNDGFTFSHDIHNIPETTSSATLSNENSETVTFTVPSYTFDKAGHFTAHDVKTVTMPFAYGKIVGDAGAGSSASATFDTLTFNSDDWLTATVTKDKVVYSHDYPKKIDDTSSVSDVNGNGDTITLETLEKDEKGHVIKVNQNTVTLPYGYKIFKDSNDTIGVSTADSTQDTFVFKGDTWIKPTVTNDLVTFTHIGPVNSTYTSKMNVTPTFGETFTIEDHYFDSMGHKFKTETHTVQIPKGSLTDAAASGADVITQLNFVESTGALSTTRKNLSELVLTGYTKELVNDDIDARDTLAQALSKLQTQIHDEENARAQAIKDLLGGENINEAFDTIQEIAAWLEGNDSGADGIIDAIATLNGDINTEGSVQKQLKDAIDALDVSDNEVDGQYVTHITQTDGKISVNRKLLPSNTDEAQEGFYVSRVLQTNGAVTVERVALPSVAEADPTTIENQYVSDVYQENGQVIVKRNTLPTYILTTGETNGTLKFNETEVPVAGLGTAAFENKETFAVSTILTDTKYDYIVPEVVEKVEDDGETQKTIEWLFNRVAELEARIKALEPAEEPETPEEEVPEEAPVE